MKRITAMLLALIMALSLAACGKAPASQNSPQEAEPTTANGPESSEPATSIDHTPASMKASPDKYTWYVKDYIGKNAATLGYTSLGGNRLDRYGSGLLEFVFITYDGSYIDISNEDSLKDYVVVSQNLEPNTEIKLAFEKDDEGEEYDSLIDWQSHEEIVLCVEKIGDSNKNDLKITSINPSPDKYTYYVKDYFGRNLASCGYTSLGGDRRDKYGNGNVKFVIIPDDDSYIDPKDTEALKNYVVTGQNYSPNSELMLEYSKDSDGKEYSNLIDYQNIEEIELYVSRID